MAHVRARVEPGEEAVARRILPDRAFALYRAMPVADRRHALDVVDRLLAGIDPGPNVRDRLHDPMHR